MGVPPAVEPVIRIIDDAEMARLHGDHLGETKTTDVLAFPASEADGEGPGGAATGAGDIALCWDAVERQAAGEGAGDRLGEAVLLCVHGLAHLLGHDHGTRGEGRRMHRLERRGLLAARVSDAPRPYAPWMAGGAGRR